MRASRTTSPPTGRSALRRTKAIATALLAAALGGCHSGGGPAAEQAEGARLYREWDCGLCHGARREGNELGPPLDALAREWDADGLAAYLRDPASGVESRPRLRELQAYYPEARMPAYDYPAERRLALARWLLAPADAEAR